MLNPQTTGVLCLVRDVLVIMVLSNSAGRLMFVFVELSLLKAGGTLSQQEHGSRSRAAVV